MNSITFIDTEIDHRSRKILDIGSIREDGSYFHSSSVAGFTQFLKGSQFICGHNILKHDIKYIGEVLKAAGVNPASAIDTLYLSPLLFPARPYHALLKDDKLQTEESNNPLNDCIKAKELFFDEITAFRQTGDRLKQIFYLLLNDKTEFQSFFRFLEYTCDCTEPETAIRQLFKNEICEQAGLDDIISESPVELAYCLSLINAFIQNKKIHSITPPWVLKNYPEVERIMLRLRNKPCVNGCTWCNNALDIHKGLKRFFGFDAFTLALLILR